jgi:hypothetical protein
MRDEDELLSRQPRIRRGAEWPNSVEEEHRRKAKYSRELRTTAQDGTFVLRYRKSRWRRMIMGQGCVKRRDLFCWITTKKRRVGALNFVEFEPDILISNDDFFNTMDADYHADAHLAEVLCAAWDAVVPDVLDYGPVLEFRLAWVAPEYARSGLWATAAKAIIEAEFDDHSILVMKAFPLEYERRAPRGSPAYKGLERRQAAMVRYYERLFGVDRFPGMFGDDGWLWRPNPRIADIVPAPKGATGCTDPTGA